MTTMDSYHIEQWRRWRKRAEPGSAIAILINRYDILAAETWRPEHEQAIYLQGFEAAVNVLATSSPNDSFISYDDLVLRQRPRNYEEQRALLDDSLRNIPPYR